MKVVIIGAGVAGLGIGWRLLQAGAQVTILDRGLPAQGASWAAAGMLALIAELQEAPAAERDLALQSSELWPGFSAELELVSGLGLGFARGGALLLSGDAARLDGLDGRGQVVDAAGARALAPMLAGDITGGLWVVAGFAGEDDLLAGMRIVDAADTASLLQRFVLDRLDGQTPIAGPSPGRLEPWPASAEPVDFEATLRTLLRDDSPPILATYFGGVNTTGVVASATFLRHWWSFANGNDDIVFWPADGAWVATVTEFDIFALWRPLVAWGGCVRGLDEVRFAPAP